MIHSRLFTQRIRVHGSADISLRMEHAVPLAIPRLFSWRGTVSAPSRVRIAGMLAGIAIMAVISYIVAVQAMLLGGEALRGERRVLEELEQETAVLQGLLAERRSPLAIQASSRVNGMVEVTTVRYVTAHPTVALSLSAAGEGHSSRVR